MPTNPRVTKAFRAMKSLGISEGKVKPVLKNLLKLYDKNWELIEEENYRALADAIFDYEETQAAELKKKAENSAPAQEVHEAAEAAEATEEPERPLKRLRRRYQEGTSAPVNNSTSNSAGASLIKPKEEPTELRESSPQIQNDSQAVPEISQPNAGDSRVESQSSPTRPIRRNKGKEPVSPKSLTLQERSDPFEPGSPDGSQPTALKKLHATSVAHPMRLRDRGKQPLSPTKASGEKNSRSERASKAAQVEEQKVERDNSLALIKPKEEPFTDDLPHVEIPLAVIHPEPSQDDCTNGNGAAREQDGSEPSSSHPFGGDDPNDGGPVSSSGTGANGEVAKGSGQSIQVAASPCGKVKIALSFDLAQERPEFHVPHIDAVLEMVKDKCLRTQKDLNSSFSVEKMMNDMCLSFLELGTASTCSLNGSIGTEDDTQAALPIILPLPPCNGTNESGQAAQNVNEDKDKANEENGQDKDCAEETDSPSLLAEQCQASPGSVDPLNNVIDIAKGQERVIISYVNEVNNECPPSFYYIPQNAVFQNAYVNFSLARIGDDNCCSTCSGDCLSLATPCACTHEMGGDFAYTNEGLVKEEFLKECVSMNRAPEKHCQVFCKECPLERSKNDDIIEPCKGHLLRKFIKECWSKCGCDKQCGNRVVQRGISRRLQVFMSPGGKGWGLRTLEDLPKGAFVCEYVGEVLTNAELFDRVSRSPKGEKHSYPVLLDADWASEGVLKDEEALCLDATYYGNVARFINHRCFDSNLVEIPVEVETPDHHYYHLAFFTTRKVKAMEELTWDYGIDFDDIDHPVKAFRCQCGSKYCRNIKRSSRSRSGPRR